MIREDGKPAHVWVKGHEVGCSPKSKLYNMTMCKNCGVLKGPDKYPETACKSHVTVKFRTKE